MEYAKYCYLNYPTIVNNIPKEGKRYDNTLENHAIIDNNLACAQGAIGESSNLAQLALTYSYNSTDKKYSDYVCILSVLAQVAIDNAKRRFDIDLVEEIERIKQDMDIDKNKYPIFWKHIKDRKVKDGKKFSKEKINNKLECPMNYLINLKFKDSRSSEKTLPMEHFFQNFELNKNDIRRKSKKVESLIQKYSLSLYEYVIDDDDDNYLLLRDDFDELINEIKSVYISNDYLGLMAWLVNRAFLITPNIKSNEKTMQRKTNNNKAILLKTLYSINSKSLLQIFSKNMSK